MSARHSSGYLHLYECHRHDYPKTHFPGTEGGAPVAVAAAAPAAPTESMDLLSFDAPAPAPAAASAAAAPTCDGMMDAAATGALVPTQQPQPPTSYANDLLTFGAAAPAPAAPAQAAAPAPAGGSGHVSFSSLTPGDDINNHDYEKHQHGQYPKDHWPGTGNGAPPAKPIDPHVGFRASSDDDLNRHDYEQHQHGLYPKTHWVAGGDAEAQEDATDATMSEAPAVAAVNPFDQFASAPPPAGGPPAPQQQQQQQPPAGGSNDLLNFP